MGFSLEINVSVLTVFLQGLLSFFSPCVLPLIPIYIGYLSGGTGKRGEDGKIHFERKRVMIHTVCFVAGISFAFFLLGLGFSTIGNFFKDNQVLFARIGGVLVILFGVYQLGFLGSSRLLGKERRLPLKLNLLAMSPLTALIMGFVFSFAWTPCVGPALASVLLMAASASTQAQGMLLIGVYTLGFVIPFLAVGLFTTTLLEFFKTHMKVVQYTVKAGGALMVLMGILMLTGGMNAVSGYLSSISPGGSSSGNTAAVTEAQTEQESETEKERETQPESGTEAQTEKETQTESSTEPETEQESETSSESEAATEQQTEAGSERESESETQAGGEAVTEHPTEGETESESRPDTGSGTETETETEPETEVKIPAIDFTLQDQYGNWHTLSDYKGKTVFLNFWATWCPPCKAEMPDIQKIYETYDQEGEDALVVLGIAAPLMGQETTQEGIEQFLEANGYTYPVLMDTTGEMFYYYGITAFPTTFMIDRDGNVFGYVSGQLSEELMISIIEQTMEGKRR